METDVARGQQRLNMGSTRAPMQTYQQHSSNSTCPQEMKLKHEPVDLTRKAKSKERRRLDAIVLATQG